VGDDVADVAEEGEVRRLGNDLEDIIAFRRFEVQVRDDLERHCGGLERARRRIWGVGGAGNDLSIELEGI